MANLFQFTDHTTFPEDLGDLLRDDPDFRGIRYGKAFPKSKEETPCIRYRLLHRVPGIDHIERKKPRLRREFVAENKEIVQVWSQWMTCVYQWDVCAASLEEADEILERFDRFLRASVKRMIERGARDFIFDEQVVDSLLPMTKDIEARSLRWVAYLHQLEARVIQPIDEIRIRVLESRTDGLQAIIRGPDLLTPDGLDQTYIDRILCVSDAAPTGIARESDYIQDVDFTAVYDPANNKTWLMWIEAGRKPAPGATYYLRYLYWDNWSRLNLPVPF